jgi:nicotinamide-nucleotide amidase
MIVETLAVGTELLLGQIVNGNAADIGTRLADAGLDHYHQVVVGDNVPRITEAITVAVGRADALVITGGIGPTQDDVTREALAAAAGVPLEFSDTYAGSLARWWEERGRVMPESNLRQAWYPRGAEMIPNPKGTAPGLQMRVGNCRVFVLPGVPAEMLPMVDDHVIPALLADEGEQGVVISRIIRTWGESESRIDELLADLFTASTNPTVAYLASAAEIKVRLTAKAADRAAARALIVPVEEEVRRRLGPRVFGADDHTVERILLADLERRGWTVGTAESATGGMIAAAITAVPGASASFVGSVVAYDRAVKEATLGVPSALIDEHGVVSEPVAIAMAEGAARVLGADVVVATTGAAGPDPHGAPVGTMIVAVRTPEGARAHTLRMPGDRERVRAYTVTAALHHLRLALAGEWWE